MSNNSFKIFKTYDNNTKKIVNDNKTTKSNTNKRYGEQKKRGEPVKFREIIQDPGENINHKNRSKQGLTKFRDMDSNRSSSGQPNKEPPKFRNLDEIAKLDESEIHKKISKFNKNVEKDETVYMKTKEFHLDINNTKKKPTNTIDYWNYGDSETKTLLHSGNIVYEFSDLDEEDKKFWRDVFRKRNEELRLKEENKKEQDKIWKKNNPRDSKLSEDIRKLFNDFSINDEFWDEIYEEYSTGNFDYNEFIDIVGIKTTDKKNLIKEHRNIKKKLGQIEGIEEKLNTNKKVTDEQKEKIKRKCIYEIRRKSIEKLLE